MPPAADCATGCATLAACASSGNACEALPADFEAGCNEICGPQPDNFLGLLNSAGSCGDMIDLFSSSSPEFCGACHGPDSEACGGVGPGPDPGSEHQPECDGIGAHLADCVAESCAPASEFMAGLTAQMILVCDQNWAQIEPQAAAFEQATCQQLAEVVDSIINGSPEQPSPLQGFCADGPANDAMTCESACGAYIPCLPPDDPNIAPINYDQDVCVFSCAINTEEAAVFQCFAGAADCQALQACIPM